jgi:hypothetical protein
MSAYDDPDLLRKFREAMSRVQIGRYAPEGVAQVQGDKKLGGETAQGDTHVVGLDASEDGMLAESTASLEVPQHMIRGTHDLRQNYTGENGGEIPVHEIQGSVITVRDFERGMYLPNTKASSKPDLAKQRKAL